MHGNDVLKWRLLSMPFHGTRAYVDTVLAWWGLIWQHIQPAQTKIWSSHMCVTSGSSTVAFLQRVLTWFPFCKLPALLGLKLLNNVYICLDFNGVDLIIFYAINMVAVNRLSKRCHVFVLWHIGRQKACWYMQKMMAFNLSILQNTSH